jgi:hypothetical protein
MPPAQCLYTFFHKLIQTGLVFFVMQLLVHLNSRHQKRLEQLVLVSNRMILHQLFEAMISRTIKRLVKFKGLQVNFPSQLMKVSVKTVYIVGKRFMDSTVIPRNHLKVF